MTVKGTGDFRGGVTGSARGGWSLESLTEWCQFARLGIPGVLIVAFEWWAFEISTFIVGSIGEVQLSVNTVFLQFGNMFYMVWYGIAIMCINVLVSMQNTK